jgi:signal transduction histidine kinase
MGDLANLAASRANLRFRAPPLRMHARSRFATLLIATSVLWALTWLAASGDSALYSTGRLAAWLIEPALVYLVLSFPSGRLNGKVDRRLALGTALVAVLLYVPTALLAPFPEPSPWGACGTSCPDNAFAIVSAGPWIDGVRATREVLTVVLFAAAAFSVVARTRRASRVLGLALVPVAAIAVFRAFALAFYLFSRAVAEHSTIADVLGWVFVMSLPLIALAFGAGLVGQRVFAGSALEELGRDLGSHAGAGALRQSLAHALRDPDLRVDYWVESTPGWVDEGGWPIPEPAASDGRAVTLIRSDGHLIAAITHDGELTRDPALVRAASSYALTALENERLVRQLEASVDEIRDSRARIVSAADRERRKIERDLHDGAQQRLVALRIKLALMAERLAPDLPDEAAHIHDLEHEVDATIEQVRSFARGIYPPLLAERGLAEALRAAARGSAIPITVDVPHLRRYPLELESTVYFACVEALQNAGKHARGAANIWITVSESDDQLRFRVRDNGAGFRPNAARGGSGLANIRDRLAAIGGGLDVESTPGDGATVMGFVPTA